MKWSNKTNLLIFIMVCLAVLIYNIYHTREGVKSDSILTIITKDTNGRCIYNKQGMINLKNEDNITVRQNISDKTVIDGFKKSCGSKNNQNACEGMYEPSSTGEHAISYCKWKFDVEE